MDHDGQGKWCYVKSSMYRSHKYHLEKNSPGWIMMDTTKFRANGAMS